MFRTYQTTLDASGNGSISISPFVESVEWDVYQIAVQTIQYRSTCAAEIRHNTFYLCGTLFGSKNSANGPPDVIVHASETLSIMWTGGVPGDQATAGIWYNENPVGTTYSTAH